MSLKSCFGNCSYLKKKTRRNSKLNSKSKSKSKKPKECVRSVLNPRIRKERRRANRKPNCKKRKKKTTNINPINNNTIKRLPLKYTSNKKTRDILRQKRRPKQIITNLSSNKHKLSFKGRKSKSKAKTKKARKKKFRNKYQ